MKISGNLNEKFNLKFEFLKTDKKKFNSLKTFTKLKKCKIRKNLQCVPK